MKWSFFNEKDHLTSECLSLLIIFGESENDVPTLRRTWGIGSPGRSGVSGGNWPVNSYVRDAYQNKSQIHEKTFCSVQTANAYQNKFQIHEKNFL